MIRPYEVTDFCNNHNISVEELLLLHRIYTKQKNLKQEVNFNIASELYQKQNKDTHEYKKLVKLLEEKEFIINENEDKNKIFINKLKVSDKFIQSIFVTKEIAFQEALSVYPNYLVIDGKEVQAKTCKEGTAYLEEEYYKTIKGGDRFEHNRFIELTRVNFQNKKYASEKFITWLKNWGILAPIIEENIQKTSKQATYGNKRR